MSAARLGLALGALGFVLPFVLPPAGLGFAGQLALSVFLLAAAFWLFEPVPIYATSLLIILLEVALLSGEGPLGEAHRARGYAPLPYADYLATLASPIVVLFLGGFVLAAAAVKHGFDRNLTRLLLRPFGTRPRYILLGLMAVTAALSAFMSNTATTAMMVTVVLPVVAQLEPGDPFRVGLALGVPFAANIGGIATPIGTPPNAVVLQSLARQGVEIAFTDWMILALPLAAVGLLCAWGVLLALYRPRAAALRLKLEGAFDRSRPALVFYGVFALTVLAWVTEGLHGLKSGMVALVPVALLTATGVVTREEVRRLPWEVLWLVAGGLSLGLAMEHTGLAAWVVAGVDWGALGSAWLLLGFGALAMAMSNFLSNTVTATLLVPLGVSLGLAGDGLALDWVVGSLVIGVAASLAMVLPISTPPNAIAISTGLCATRDMARAGLVVGAVGLLLVALAALFYWPALVSAG